MALPTQIYTRLAALGTSPADVAERFVRGTGPGGQKINKTSSTVVLHHRPTDTTVRCQDERSQAANRERAWAELCTRLETLRREAHAAARDARERDRRRNRPKSHGQKQQMLRTKKHRARTKSGRGRVGSDRGD